MLITIGGQKGGTGKSTIATNLAVDLTLKGRQVLLLDSDRQLTASDWADARTSDDGLPPVICVQRSGKLFTVLRDLEARYDDVIVDAGGFDSVELRTAVAASDALYSPVKASSGDLWTLEAMTKLVSEARDLNPDLKAYLLLTMTPTNPRVQDVKAAFEMLARYPAFTACRTTLADRRAYRDALGRGRGVVEHDDPKATAEVHALTLEILTHAGLVQPSDTQAA